MILKRAFDAWNCLKRLKIQMLSKRTFGQSKMPWASGNENDFEENIAPNAKYPRLPNT